MVEAGTIEHYSILLKEYLNFGSLTRSYITDSKAVPLGGLSKSPVLSMMSTTNGSTLGIRSFLIGTEELKRSGSSGPSANDEAQQQQPQQRQQQQQPQSVARNRPPKSRPQHPTAKNKDAKKHLARLRRLGFQNFNEVDIDYWEPCKAGEEKS